MSMAKVNVLERFLIFFALCLLAWRCPGDVSLNQGESFTYTFTSIPLDTCDDLLVENAHFWFNFVEETFESGVDSVKLEAFESNTNDIPFFSRILNVSGGIQSPLGNHWADLQGVFRITMVSGSATLSRFGVGAVSKVSGAMCSYNSPTITAIVPPVLSISRRNSEVFLCWAMEHREWQLEYTTNLDVPIQWMAVTNRPTVDGARLCIAQEIGSRRGFYRLREPSMTHQAFR